MTGKHFHERGDKNRVRKAYKSKGDDATFSRFVKLPKAERMAQAHLLNTPRVVAPSLYRKPWAIEGRSMFHRKGVKKPSQLTNLLVSGHNNVKIGRDVRKGKLYRGYWIYTLTLEERRTCPRTCQQWATCYGNNMPYSKRIDHTEDGWLVELEREIDRLINWRSVHTKRSPTVPRQGILIRLHALGDFYSSEYVAFWAAQLRKHERLAIYGYTARRLDDPIGRSIAGVKRKFGRRFAIRYSDGNGDSDCTVSINRIEEAPSNAFVCPEQTGASEACGKCGLCWNTEKNVAFLQH